MKILIEAITREFYQALIDKNTEYEGIFYVGIKTTRVFCRPTCSRKKPKFDNCEFYQTAQEALLASFKPCKRCRPLSHPSYTSTLVHALMEAVERNPEKRWMDQDFQEFSVTAKTARRHFQKRFGITFIAYARNKRIEVAMKDIIRGGSVIEAQLNAGYESSSGFRDAFSKVMGGAPTSFKQHRNVLKTTWLDTLLGPMLAVSDDKAIYLLEFVDRYDLEQEIEQLKTQTNSVIILGGSDPIDSIETELKYYFEGKLKEFKTPLHLLGSPFQKLAWDALIDIPYGTTISYANLATAAGMEPVCETISEVNKANKLAIVIPCHRIINGDGGLDGYACGARRKEWLINHEKKFK